MSIISLSFRRFALAICVVALAVWLGYRAAAYAAPDASAWALVALCLGGLGFAGYRRSRGDRLRAGIE